MLMNIVFLLGPFLLSPAIVYGLQLLFPVFITQGAKTFLAMDVPGSIARRVGTDIAIRCVITYLLCWFAGFGCYMLQWPLSLTIGFSIAAVFLSLIGTIMMVRKKLAIKSWGDSALVGLITFAGGNLPLMVLIAILLFVLERLSGD